MDFCTSLPNNHWIKCLKSWTVLLIGFTKTEWHSLQYHRCLPVWVLPYFEQKKPQYKHLTCFIKFSTKCPITRFPHHGYRSFTCPTPFQVYVCKKDSHLCKSFSFISSFLSSRAASGQVLSAFVSLTSVFGMDTGDPHSCRHCFSESLFSQNHIEEVLKLFACLGVSKLRPRPISFMSLQALRLFHS